MREEPTAADLLDTARDLLLADLLPKLPEAQRFAARMVANALAIAAREARDDGGWIAEAEAGIAALTGGDAARFAASIDEVRKMKNPKWKKADSMPSWKLLTSEDFQNDLIKNKIPRCFSVRITKWDSKRCF